MFSNSINDGKTTYSLVTGAIVAGDKYMREEPITGETENTAAYEQQIKNKSTDPYSYDRLMIHYRKEKQYQQELNIINNALKIFEAQLIRQQPKLKEKKSASIKELSAKLNKAVGLIDKKGKLNYLPEPLARWTKRKQTVEEKIAK